MRIISSVLSITITISISAQTRSGQCLDCSKPAGQSIKNKRAKTLTQTEQTTGPSVTLLPFCEGEDVVKGRVSGGLSTPEARIVVTIYNNGASEDGGSAFLEPDSSFRAALQKKVGSNRIAIASLFKGNQKTAQSIPILSCSSPSLSSAGAGAQSLGKAQLGRNDAEDNRLSATTNQDQAGCDAAPDSQQLTKPQIAPLLVGDSSVKGTAPILTGVASLCVNGEPVHPQSARSNSVFLVDGNFELRTERPFEANQRVRVIVFNDRVRLTNDIIVSDPCATQSSDSTIGGLTLDFGLRADTSVIQGKSPLKSGTVSVCINGKPTKIGDAENAVKFGDSQFTATLVQPLQAGEKVTVIVRSEDKSKRISSAFTVAASCDKKELSFQIAPKEGANTVYGTGAPSSDDSPCLVSVFVNGDAMQLVTDSGNTAWSVQTDKAGYFAARLRESLEAGQCVTLVQFNKDSPFKRNALFSDGITCVDVSNKKTQRSSNSRWNPRQQNQSLNSYQVLRAAFPGQLTTPSTSPANSGTSTSVPANTTAEYVQSFFDFGRVRSYFAGGTVLSTDGGSFVKPDLFLSFNVIKNLVWGGPVRVRNGSTNYSYQDKNSGLKTEYKRLMTDLIFEARLTAIPTVVTGCKQEDQSKCSTSASGGSESQSVPVSNLETFIASRKAATLQGGVSFPYVVTTWTHKRDPYALSIGPIAKIGFQTPTDTVDPRGRTILAETQKQFYVWHAFGGRIGFQRMSHDRNVAPDTISYIDVMMGRYSNFDNDPLRPILTNLSKGIRGCDLQADGSYEVPLQTPNTNCMYERYSRPWRLGIEGLFKVPNYPFVLGFSANVRQNLGLHNSSTVNHSRDDLRFFIGTKFNLGNLVGKLKNLDDQLPK